MKKDVEATLFADLGAVLDAATASGVSWAKIYGVVSTLQKVAEAGLMKDLQHFDMEKSNETTNPT